MSKFIACTIKTFKEETEIVAAAALARTINPSNSPPVERIRALFATALGVREDDVKEENLTPLQIAQMTDKYWGPDVRLTVTFKEKTDFELQRKIVAYMNVWGQNASIEFKLIDSTNWQNGDVRISRARGGYWSYLGTDVRHIGRNRQTMNLEAFTLKTPESEYKRVVTHEAGHTLGFPHEHMRADLVALLDESKTVRYFGRTQGWKPEEVRAQVLTPLSERQIFSTPADQDSIMCYQIPGECTKNGKPIRGGTEPTATDLAFAASRHPKKTTSTGADNMLLAPGTKKFRLVIESDSPINVTMG